MKLKVKDLDALKEYKMRRTIMAEYHKTLCDMHEQALAEVLDHLYLGMLKDFVDYENRTHNLGGFKEQVKIAFHDIIIRED